MHQRCREEENDKKQGCPVIIHSHCLLLSGTVDLPGLQHSGSRTP
jgi:hypothetical protein